MDFNRSSCLIKSNVFEKIEARNMTETTEQQECMCVKISAKQDSNLYHFFCEPNSKKREQSRINFFNVDNFPDGIFVCFHANDEVKVTICELKRTPINKLTQLSRQFFSGYIHAKMMLSILEIPSNDVQFSYKVFMLQDRNKEAEYNVKMSA